MTEKNGVERLRVARRAILLAPVALGGCDLFEGWFGTEKKPLPGKREPVMATRRGLAVDEGAPKVTLPPPVTNAAWPQAGGNPAHLMGHLAASQSLGEAWRADIGAGGGYRRKLMAQPVVADGRVYTMDSDAVVTAFALANGARIWRVDSTGKDVRSTNIGGGLAYDGGTLYAVNGLGDLVAFEAATGSEKWRKDIGVPLRSAPTVVEGRMFVVTIQDRLLALATDDGRQLWTHQSTSPQTAILGQPAPAYSNGLVVAGFGSGELACMHADSGNVTWTDSLGSGAGLATLADFSSIRGRPVISNGRVFAVGVGGLMLGLDLPSGRRLWERQVAGIASPWVAGDWLFMISTAQELGAVALDDGRVSWVSALPRFENQEKLRDPITWYGPVLVGDRLVVTGTDSTALSVSPYSGEILSRQKLSRAAAPLEPVVAEGTLLIVSNDARLLALR
jgi:outer membrane protein assembly factor BamB